MASGMGHDHFAIAVNYRWPHLILGGPSEILVSKVVEGVCEMILSKLIKPLPQEFLDPFFCHFGYHAYNYQFHNAVQEVLIAIAISKDVQDFLHLPDSSIVTGSEIYVLDPGRYECEDGLGASLSNKELLRSGGDNPWGSRSIVGKQSSATCT